MSKEQAREALAAEAHRLLCKFGADTVRASMFTTDENVGAMAESERAAKEAIDALAALASPAAEPVQALTEGEKRELLDWVSACQSAYHIDATPRHRFSGFGCDLDANRDGLVAYVNELLALRASPPATKEAKAGWQPIETAPRTKAMFVVQAFDVANGFTGGRPYTTDPWCVWRSPDGAFARWPHNFEPTHWMPLPPAPEGA